MPRHLAQTRPQRASPNTDPLPVEGLPLDLGPRYSLERLLEVGGMGEVWHATDNSLKRRVVIKIVRSSLDATSRNRFRLEAEDVAGLQHPGIVPVYDSGVAADGRPFFVMRPVEGSPLHEAIARLHAVSTEERWRTAADSTSLHRLVDHLRRAAQAVAFAHDRGVLHCDLKPSNILIGRYGEVEVADWGLARRLGAPQTARPEGTPLYIAPEAARCEPFTAAVDVWGLGACLYELLTGCAPWKWKGPRRDVIIRHARTQSPPPPASQGGPPIPPPLDALVQAALAFDPQQRTPSALAFSEALGAWLERVGRQEAALRLVLEADTRMLQAEALDQQADHLEEDADRRLAIVKRNTANAPRPPSGVARMPHPDKVAAWALKDRARAIAQDAGRIRAEAVAALLGAAAHDPDCAEAHDRLSDHHRAAHDAARARGAWLEAAQAARLVEVHGAQRHRAWIAGQSRLFLCTHPPVQVRLRPYREEARLLTLGPPTDLGLTPLIDVLVPSGSHQLDLIMDGVVIGVLPIEAPRGGTFRWGPGPDGEEALDLRPLFDVPEGCRPILAGPYRSGRDPNADALPPRTYWVPTFYLQERAVTNRDWITFLDALVAAGDEELALRCAPRMKGSRPGEPPIPLYARRPDGGFALTRDADGDLWEPDWPVIFIDAAAAELYAAWRSKADGRPWRLPSEVEYEKAARGADSRFYPWGNHLDGDFTCFRESPTGPGKRLLMSSADDFPIDTSPYGIRGMAGNARTWCLEAWRDEGPRVDEAGRLLLIPGDEGARVVRGAAYSASWFTVRSAHRSRSDASGPRESIGLRLACGVGRCTAD